MGLKCPFELELVENLQNECEPGEMEKFIHSGEAAAHVYASVPLFFPVGGPHLFTACVFVRLLRNKTHLFGSNEKHLAASKVWAHFKVLPIKNCTK